MKRTLKRGLKVREIAKREAIGLSMGVPLNLVSWVHKGVWDRAGTHLACSSFMKVLVDAILLGPYAGQHRFACVGDRKAGEW